MPWFDQPSEKGSHKIIIPSGTLIKGNDGTNLIIRNDTELEVVTITEFTIESNRENNPTINCYIKKKLFKADLDVNLIC